MGLLTLRAQGPLEALLRFLGLILVFALTIWGFWLNGQRQAERLSASHGLGDAAGLLSETERGQVRSFITELRARYGIEARIVVSQGEPAAPDPGEAAPKTLFLGLSPALGKAVAVLPPLARSALGPDFARQLTEEHFPFHFQPGRRWQKGLILALDLIRSRLAALDQPGADNQTGANTPTAPQPGPKESAKP